MTVSFIQRTAELEMMPHRRPLVLFLITDNEFEQCFAKLVILHAYTVITDLTKLYAVL